MPPFQHNPVRSHVDSADHLRRHPDEGATWNAPLPSTDVFGRAFSQLTPPSSSPDKTAAAKTPGMMKKDFQKPSNFATGTILTDAALSPSRGVTGRRRKLSSQGATYSRNSAAPARWRAKETSATSPRRNATPWVRLYCQTIMCKPLALTPVSPGLSFAKFPAYAGCCSWSDAIWGRCCLSFGCSLTPPRMHPQAREETGSFREEYSHEDEEDRRTRGGGPSVSMVHASKSSR